MSNTIQRSDTGRTVELAFIQARLAAIRSGLRDLRNGHTKHLREEEARLSARQEEVESQPKVRYYYAIENWNPRWVEGRVFAFRTRLSRDTWVAAEPKTRHAVKSVEKVVRRAQQGELPMVYFRSKQD